MITPMRVDSAASAAFETTSEHGLGNSGSFSSPVGGISESRRIAQIGGKLRTMVNSKNK